MTLNGLNLVLSVDLVEDGEPYEIRRTWRERFFTRPWQPLKTTRTVVPKIPCKGALQLGNTIVIHPATYEALKHSIEGPHIWQN